jgi:tripartite-type tricarboxylate transporter receptor subunit TctC
MSAPSTWAGRKTLRPSCSKPRRGLNFQIIPYRGTPDVIVALLRNDVQLMVDFYAPMKSTLLDNKIRAVATTGKERSPFFTDVPTVAEAGVRDTRLFRGTECSLRMARRRRSSMS